MSKKVTIALIIFLITLFTYNINLAHAEISACAVVSLSPNSLNGDESKSFNFGIINNDQNSNLLRWVKITVPSSNFVITSGDGPSNSGVVVASDGSSVIIKTTLSSGETGDFPIGITAGLDAVSGAQFTVQASDDSDGANPVTCSGDSGITVSATAQTIQKSSNLTVSVSDTVATISWVTNTASSGQINYGITTAYGSHSSESTGTTSHSISLSGLSPNTTYHFKVTTTDSNGGVIDFNDNTFRTAVEGTTTTVTTTITNTNTVTVATKVIRDISGPKVTLITDFSKPFKLAPNITGRAVDSSGVLFIEYSIDDGKNWIHVESDGSEPKSLSFDFTPNILDDGNYKIKVRAKDSLGNTGTSTGATLIIDRLPPSVGGSLFSLGPVILKPRLDGSILTLAGTDIKLTLSAVGGPTNLDIVNDQSTFNLVKNIESGLWSGMVNFANAGIRKIKAVATDGAQNKTEREFSEIVVLPRGQIADGHSIVTNAEVKVFVIDSDTKRFNLWDGVPYGQENPQKVKADGTYSLTLPPGTYYIEVVSTGMKTARSQIFTLNEALPINSNIVVKPGFTFYFWGITNFEVNTNYIQEASSQSDVIGTEFPEFLEINYLGKPTVISFVSTWAPETSGQISELQELKVNHSDINVVAVGVQESKGKMLNFASIGNYSIPIVADPDGALVEPLGIQNLPTNIFLDRKGIIKKIIVGYLDQDKLLENILN